MPNPGGYALVMDPTFVGPANNVRFSKVLIDNGSSINIMYQDIMQKLGIKENMLEPSKTTFHGIVPGLSCAPMGKIRIDVMFGNRDNCRVENLMFEVVDLDSPYHALMGRPALAKFMASTHVAYLKMKMPGPRGVITIIGDYKRSMACATAGSNLAETLIIAEEKKRLKRAVEIAETVVAGKPLSGMTNPNGGTSFQVAKDVKKVALDELFSERHALIDAGLDPKYESELISFLRENRDIFAWSTSDLQGVPRELAEHALHVRPDAKPVKQPLRRFADDRRKAI
jgi:hypothetical protein